MNNIITSSDLLKDLQSYFINNTFSRIAVLVDENTDEYCFPIIKSALPSNFIKIKIKSGEEEKNLKTCAFIWEEMTRANLDRHSLFVNLGGGVIGDMGGFCAATYKRGIKFIQIPTTLLSQVDASIGGKLGIDFHHYKNHIGVFQNPDAVFIHTPFFNTLPSAELKSGFAEIIKHCLIADSRMWNIIKDKSFEKQNLNELVSHSIGVKARIVEEDPTEKGIRKALNFGHTIGHAVESYFLEKPNEKLLHGEAIAIGMICESYLCEKFGLISKEELDQIEKTILNTYSFVEIPKKDFELIINHTIQDKKNRDSKVLAALLQGIGAIKINVELPSRDIEEALNYYNTKEKM